MELISKKIFVVVNPADHAALVAGSVFVDLLQRHSYQVSLISLCDPLPKDEDAHFTFVGCGEYSSLKAYYEGNAVLLPWLKKLYHNSTFHISDRETDRLFPDSYFGKLQTVAVDQFEIQESIASRAFNAYFTISEDWLTNKLGEEEMYKYSALLRRCLSYLEGMAPLNLNGTLADTNQVMEEMWNFNRAAALRCKTIVLNNTKYRYFSTNGLATLWLIRRIYLINQNFIHASMGEMGMIIYSNLRVNVDYMKDVKMNLKACVGGINFDS